jgi:hypothetical protein
MYVLIEHSGTPEHTKTASYVADFIEAEYGGTVDHIVSGEGDNVIFYNEDLEKIGEFLPHIPANDAYIRHILDTYYEEME